MTPDFLVPKSKFDFKPEIVASTLPSWNEEEIDMDEIDLIREEAELDIVPLIERKVNVVPPPKPLKDLRAADLMDFLNKKGCCVLRNKNPGQKRQAILQAKRDNRTNNRAD